MVHVTLVRLRRQRVDLLLHLEHVERRDTKDLRLAALEDRGAVNPWDHLDLSVERADVREAATVDAHTLGEDATANDPLRDRLVRPRDLAGSLSRQLTRFDLCRDLLLDALLELVIGVLTLLLVCDLVDTRQLVGRETVHRGENLVGVGQEDRVVLDFLCRVRCHLGLCAHELRDERLGRFETVGHDLLVGLDGARFDQIEAVLCRLSLDHHDRDVLRTVGAGDDAAGHHEVEHGLVDLLRIREGNPLIGVLAVTRNECEPHTGDRTGERQTRDLSRCRRRIDRERVVELAGGDREHGDDDLHLVPQPVDERRTQRAVDQPADENRVGRGTSLPTEERAGDLPRGIAALLDVHCEREEVEVVFWMLAGRRRREKHRLIVEVCSDRTLRLLCETTRLEAHGALSEAAVIEHGLRCGDFWTLQGHSPYVSAGLCPTFTEQNRQYILMTTVRSSWLISSRKPLSLSSERDPPPRTSFLPACSVLAKPIM